MAKEKTRTSFRIEKVSPHLAERLLKFRKRIYEEDEPTLVYTTKKEPPQLEEIIAKARVTHERPAAFVALKGDEVIGEAYAVRNAEFNKDDEVYMGCAVSKEARGTGVIYALLNALSKELEKENVKTVIAEVFEKNIASIRLMEKLGAKADTKLDTFYDEKRDTHYRSFKYTFDIVDLIKKLNTKLTE